MIFNQSAEKANKTQTPQRTHHKVSLIDQFEEGQ
jgi:hypothetical protein